MEQATIVKTSLIIALQTTNIHAFTDQIKSTVIPLYNIKDSQNANIFHEIASSVIKEDFLIEALQVLIVEFNDRYFEEAATIVKSLLDSKRVCDGNSPFLDSVIYNRIVFSI